MRTFFIRLYCSELKLTENVLQCLCTCLKFLNFLFSQCRSDLSLNTVTADYSRQTQANIIDAISVILSDIPNPADDISGANMTSA